MIHPRAKQEPTRATAQRLVVALGIRDPFGFTRRELQRVLFPAERFDTDRASWTAQAIHLARDEGWVTTYGRKVVLTDWGREQVRLAEPFHGGAA